MELLLLASAPVLIILFYIYFRDKYEKEPILLLLFALTAGALIIPPAIILERLMMSFGSGPFYTAFFSAGLIEELLKFIIVLSLFYWRKAFNEKFDGIVYAVFVSLGFAWVENILYVQNESIGYFRAVTAVPGHAIWGIAMGYHLGLAKFLPLRKIYHLWMAFFIPFLMHGLYDYFVMTGTVWGFLLFVPFVVYLYFFGFRKLRKASREATVMTEHPQQ